jgi:hypothetical protein
MLAIVWDNPTTGTFDDIYELDAAIARVIVQRAIDDWNNVITNFNHAGGGNTFNLSVVAETLQNTESRGQVQAIDMVYDSLGAPTAGKVRLDNDGGGKGWFFDETPMDDVDFTSIGSPFAATFVE